jgi:hypothetical protein
VPLGPALDVGTARSSMRRVWIAWVLHVERYAAAASTSRSRWRVLLDDLPHDGGRPILEAMGLDAEALFNQRRHRVIEVEASNIWDR